MRVRRPLLLKRAPIVEAVVDIDCDLPPTFDLELVEAPSRQAFRSVYATLQPIFVEHHRFETKVGPEASGHEVQRKLQALRFKSADGQQIVQVRDRGFSFNRLAPYTTLDDYLTEIERAWELYRQAASPISVLAVRLRYINRIFLPLVDGRVELDDYIATSPRLPDEKTMTFVGFLNQHAAVEVSTGHLANIVLTSELAEGELLPVILDIGVAATGSIKPEDWESIRGWIDSLRKLKNRIFRKALKRKCLDLFRK